MYYINVRALFSSGFLSAWELLNLVHNPEPETRWCGLPSGILEHLCREVFLMGSRCNSMDEQWKVNG
jgi:hypothetical protein